MAHDHLSRRAFFELGAAAAAAAALPASRHASRAPASVAAQEPFALAEATIAQLQDGMRAGRLTSRGITRAYLERIAALDRQGPTLRSLLDINPDAQTIADGLDRERREGRVRGPLHGIPVVVKDNIDTHDRMQTTAGSLALEGNYALRDAHLVERLRAAGAVILAQSESVRMGQLPVHAVVVRLERPRPAVPQPLRARPQPERLELGLGRGRERESVSSRRRNGDRRVHHQSGERVRHRRHQAHGGTRESGRGDSHRAQPGHGWADVPHRGRRRGAARRDDGRRSARPRDGDGATAISRPTTPRFSMPADCVARASACAARRRQSRHRPAGRSGHPHAARARGRGRGPRGHRHLGHPRQRRARGAVLRVQDGSQRVSRPDAGGGETPHPGGPDRVQRSARGSRDAVLRAGDFHHVAGQGSPHRAGVPRRPGEVRGADARQGDRRHDGRAPARRHDGSLGRPRRARGSRDVDGRRGRGRQLAIPGRGRAIRTSRCPRDSTWACPWGSRSTAARGASRCSSGSRTRSSRRPRRGRRRGSCRRWS